MATATLIANALHTNGWGTIDTDWLDDFATSTDGNEILPAGSGAGGNGNTVFLGMTDMPADFGEITAVDIRFRYRMDPTTYVNDTVSLTFQIFQSNESTALTNSVNSGNLASTTLASVGYLSLASPQNVTNKSLWDGLRLRIVNNYAANMGSDGSFIRLDALEVRITYTPGGTTFQENMGGTVTPAGALTNQVIGAPYEIIRPIGDISAGSWSTAPLWSKVDDDAKSSGSESDIISEAGGGNACFLDLAEPSAPDTYVGWRIRIRARNATSGTRTFTGNIARSSDSAILSVSLLKSITSTSYAWYEFPVTWDSTVENIAAIALNDLAVRVDADSSAGPTLQVAAVEVCIPLLTGQPLGAPPSWSAVSLPSKGRAGPWTTDGSRWAIGIDTSSKLAWLFEGTAPSDGHDAGDWEAVAPIAELVTSNSGIVANTPFDASTRDTITTLDAILNAAGDIVAYARTSTSSSPRGVITGVDPTDLSPTVTRTATASAGTAADNDNVRINEKQGTADAYKTAADAGSTFALFVSRLVQDTGSNVTITATPHTLYDMVGADGRQHVFYGKTDADSAQGVRQRTLRSNHTTQTEPGADATSEDLARLGVGAGWSNGTVWRVVSAHPQADGGGITALVFDSADSPTPSLETVTTRDAFDAAYEQSVVALGVNPGSSAAKGVVLWIDDAADGIYGAWRTDGGSTWTAFGELVAGSAGRTRLSAAVVDADTVAILVAAGNGDIEYYELDLAFGNTEQENMSGSISPAGARTARPRKALAATITPAGAPTKETATTKAGAVTPAGAATKRTRKTLAGTITSTAAAAVRIVVLLAAAGTITGAAAVRRTTRTAKTGQIGPAGTRTAETTKTATGTVTGTGAATKRARSTKTGTITPAAALNLIRLRLLAAAGTVTPASLLARMTQKVAAGSLTPAATTTKRSPRTYAGTITGTGQTTKEAGLDQAGSIGTAGTVSRETQTTKTGAITPAGAITRRAGKALTATIAPAAARLGKTLLDMAATISPTGASQHELVDDTIQRFFDGTLTPAGALARETRKTIAAALGTAGAALLSAAKTLQGTATPTGARTARTRTTKTGTVTPAGALRRTIRAIVEGAITAAGARTAKTLNRAAGALTAAGSLTTEVNPGGFFIQVGGALTTAGSLLRRIAATMEGTATPAGATRKKAAQTHEGTVAPTAAATLRATIRLAASATIAGAGAVTRKTAKRLTASLAAASTITRQTRRRLTGTLSPTGATRKRARLTLQAAIATSATVATQIFNVLAGPISKLVRGQGNRRGQVQSQSRSGTIRHQGDTSEDT
jgi:hypothetical protein